ncbi:MAG: hypothetical protein AB4290_12915 [Spirulina sp.]
MSSILLLSLHLSEFESPVKLCGYLDKEALVMQGSSSMPEYGIFVDRRVFEGRE